MEVLEMSQMVQEMMTVEGDGGSGFVWTSSTASNVPSGYSVPTKYYLTNASTKAGNTSFENTSGGTETGHSGNGYAKITPITVTGPSATTSTEETSDNEPEYEKVGLLNHYDGINNTGNGHSSTATRWKDLSGNNRDISTISGSIGDNYIGLNGTQSMQVPLSGNFTDMTVELTVSDVETRDTTLFNAYGAYTRLISTHVPWSDNCIYFDSSQNASNYERINKVVDFDKSQKHTITFIKSTIEGQSIYIDGNLWT